MATWALISSVLEVLLLGETLTAVHLLGIVFVVGGVGTFAWETGYENPDNLSRRRLAIELLVALGAAFFFGLEPILAKVGFAEGTPAPVGLVVKTIVATIGFVLHLYFADKLPQREQFSGRSFRWFGLAGIARTVFLLGYYLSLAIAPMNVTVPIIVANPLFVVVLSALFMPDRLEQVTWKLLVAATLIMVGILLITVPG